MKRLVPAFFLCAGLMVACRQYLPSNRYLQLRASPSHSTADARGKFDHSIHDSYLTNNGVTCLDCHRFDALLDAGTAELGAELSARALHPGSAACHYCHGQSATHMANAPPTCATCHDNLAPLRPADHDLAWDRLHAQMARVNPAQCESCHQQAQCIECHQRRDSVREVVHDRNFRSIHGIEATANPMQCGSCHREDYCIRCHEASRAPVGP